MIVVLTVFYGVYLELLIHNLVSITPATVAAGGAPNRVPTVSVRSLISSRNGTQVGAGLALFLVDWICFLVIFPPSSTFTLHLRDALIFIPYLGVLSALGFAVVFALDDPRRACRPLGVYHGLAAVAEMVWLFFAFRLLNDDIPGGEVGEMLLILVAYIAARIILCIANWLLPTRQWRVQPEVLTFVAVTLKPALLVLISTLPATQQLLEVMR